MDKILKVFITHQSNLNQTVDKVSKMFDKDYVIVVGGYSGNSFDNNIIKLNCEDCYCGLPDKVVSMFKFINENSIFNKYTHFHKLDEDLTFIKDIDFELTDYMGMVCGKHMINRNHHIGRCEGHYWNDKPYPSEISDWCEGGLSYIVSRKSIGIISQLNGKDYPLEDVMVGNVLFNNNIYPRFTNMDWYYRGTQWYDKVRTYQDFKGKEWREDGIPKWIFKTGPGSINEQPNVMKLVFTDIVEKNPGYQLFYFSDDDCVNYIRDYYGEEYVKSFDTLIPGAYRADFWRYLILYKHGGCYSDYSQVFLKPLDEIIKNTKRVFVRDTPESLMALYNAFMCCISGDEILSKTIEVVKNKIDNKDYGFNTLDVTGPRVFGKVYCDVIYGNDTTPIEIGLTHDTIILDNHQMHSIFIVNNEGQNVIVKKLDNHFEHLYGNRKHYGQLWHEKNVFK
jgi:hypothetical protein